jgi:hypothetical protein
MEQRTLPHADCGFSSMSWVSCTFTPAASASARPHVQLAQGFFVGGHPRLAGATGLRSSSVSNVSSAMRSSSSSPVSIFQIAAGFVVVLAGVELMEAFAPVAKDGLVALTHVCSFPEMWSTSETTLVPPDLRASCLSCPCRIQVVTEKKPRRKQWSQAIEASETQACLISGE